MGRKLDAAWLAGGQCHEMNEQGCIEMRSFFGPTLDRSTDCGVHLSTLLYLRGRISKKACLRRGTLLVGGWGDCQFRRYLKTR
jgi:hypothetical protein